MPKLPTTLRGELIFEQVFVAKPLPTYSKVPNNLKATF